MFPHRKRDQHMPLTPYTGPFGRPELIHLLRRTLFGVTVADLAHFNGMTLTQVADELLTFPNNTTPPIKGYSELDAGMNPDPSLVDPDVPFGSTWTTVVRDPMLAIDPTGYRIQSFMAWWTGQLVHQERNLREKMTLFLHNHMPTSGFQVFLPEATYGMNQLLRTNCLGNFRQLMYDVTVEPCMLVYLNGFLNVASAPDENYARELMELFTLGQGSGYTESDVQTAARVLTGWTVMVENGGVPVLPQMVYIPFNHDTGDKQFSGFFDNTVITGQGGPGGGAAELNALLDMIFEKEEVSKFVCREIYHFFVHGEIDATTETDVIEPLAQLFRDNAGAPDQLRIVMQALLTSDHFFSPDVRSCMVKSPADLVIGELRLFNMPFPDAAAFEAQYSVWRDLYWLIDYSGQGISEPPNVAGWPAYYLYPSYDNIWLDTATYPARNNSLMGITYGGFSTPADMVQPQSEDLELTIDHVAFVQQFSDPSDPNVLIAEAAELLFGIAVSQSVRDTLKTNYLLFGQSQDYYWTNAFNTYVADPGTTDMAAQLVPSILKWLFSDMQQAAEHHIF